MATVSTGTGVDKNFIIKLLHGFAGVIMALGGVWWATHDTPPQRGANEAAYLANDSKETDLNLEKEKTKQMKIAARSQGVLQPLIAPRPNQSRSTHTIGAEGQHFLAVGMDFIFNGEGHDVPSAVIAFQQPPSTMVGSFKIHAGGKIAWSDSWSDEPSPYPLLQLLDETRSKKNDVRWMEIYSNGQTIFKF